MHEEGKQLHAASQLMQYQGKVSAPGRALSSRKASEHGATPWLMMEEVQGTVKAEVKGRSGGGSSVKIIFGV